ncbi:DUF397 domain-containing protein [Actinoallomurus sp. CA-150999]
MNTPRLLTDWRKSSRSGSSGGNCVEVTITHAVAMVTK